MWKRNERGRHGVDGSEDVNKTMTKRRRDKERDCARERESERERETGKGMRGKTRRIE